MISRNKFDKLIHKISSINKIGDKSLSKNKLEEKEFFIVDPEDVKDLKSKNLNLLTKISILEDKLERAIFPVEKDKIKHNIMIIDSSAVTRAKLKKLFDQDDCNVFLPRDISDVDATINEINGRMESIKLVVVEYSQESNAEFGINFIELLDQGKWDVHPLIFISSASDNAVISSEHFQYVNGIIPKPWDEESVSAKIKEILK